MSARRVLVLRPDNLGDVVLFSGALKHLRALYPGARITFAARRRVLPLLELCPHVDRLVVWEDLVHPLRSRLRRMPESAWWARRVRRADRRLRRLVHLRHRADVLLLPVRSPNGDMHRVVAKLRARKKLGIAGDFSNETAEDNEAAAEVYTERLQIAPDRKHEHELEITREFLAFLGCDVPLAAVRPELWTDDGDRAWARRAVPHADGTITLAVCPGTVNTNRMYAPERYAEAIGQLTEHRLLVVLFADEGERELTAALGAHLAAHRHVAAVHDLTGRTTIRQLAEGLRACDVVLSMDSAPLHVTAALERPVVGIRGGGQVNRFWPWGDESRSRLAHNPVDCYGCNWVCPDGSFRCVTEIEPATIARELRQAIQAATARPPG